MIEIPLTKGKVALVDDEDAEMLRFRWYAMQHSGEISVYARRRRRKNEAPGRPMVSLHREVWARAHPGQPTPRTLDHVNGDGLDNRRDNLRAASPSGNQANARTRTDNTSGFKGVSWHRGNGRWQARIRVAGRRILLGEFDSREKAAHAYDDAARLYFGEFAALNFPNPGERAA